MVEKDVLIFIDFDGTIFTPEIGDVDLEIVETIREIREKGPKIFLASGRTSSFLSSKVFPDLFDGYVLAHGEEIILGSKIVHSKFIPEETVSNLIDTFDKNNIDYVCYADDGSYLNRLGSDLYTYLLSQFIEPESLKIIEDGLPISRVFKLEAWAGEDVDWDTIEKSFPTLTFLEEPNGCRIDINLSESSKARGIKRLLEFLNVDSSRTYCFGDALNDLEMFELVDYPIAMENGDEKLKDKAYLIAPSVYDNGVSKMLKKLF